jgi:hypothetical protein
MPPELEPLPDTTTLEPPLACVPPMVLLPATGPGLLVEPELLGDAPAGTSPLLHAPIDSPEIKHTEPRKNKRKNKRLLLT